MDKRVHSLSQPRLPSVAATAIPKVATKSGLLLGASEDGVQVASRSPSHRNGIGERNRLSPTGGFE
jgi:hypothetical protein